jgi:hypothetical protein
MPTQKRLLSLEELEAQMLVMLPDRELLHVQKHGSHAGGPTTITETTTQTVNNCTHSTGVQFSCNTVGSSRLMPVQGHSSHAGGPATITETTTQTVNNCTNSTGVQFSCNTVGSVDGSSHLTPVHSSRAGGPATITKTTTQTVNNCTNSTGVQFSCNNSNAW